jgi:hypothetical protein
LPELIIPDGVDAATANLLKMQMNIMQTLMNNQMAQLEKRLDYETRERHILARELAKRDSGISKIVGKAPKFDIQKDRNNFENLEAQMGGFPNLVEHQLDRRHGRSRRAEEGSTYGSTVGPHPEVDQWSRIRPRRPHESRIHHPEN